MKKKCEIVIHCVLLLFAAILLALAFSSPMPVNAQCSDGGECSGQQCFPLIGTCGAEPFCDAECGGGAYCCALRAGTCSGDPEKLCVAATCCYGWYRCVGGYCESW